MYTDKNLRRTPLQKLAVVVQEPKPYKPHTRIPIRHVGLPYLSIGS